MRQQLWWGRGCRGGERVGQGRGLLRGGRGGRGVGLRGTAEEAGLATGGAAHGDSGGAPVDPNKIFRVAAAGNFVHGALGAEVLGNGKDPGGHNGPYRGRVQAGRVPRGEEAQRAGVHGSLKHGGLRGVLLRALQQGALPLHPVGVRGMALLLGPVSILGALPGVVPGEGHIHAVAVAFRLPGRRPQHLRLQIRRKGLQFEAACPSRKLVGAPCPRRELVGASGPPQEVLRGRVLNHPHPPRGRVLRLSGQGLGAPAGPLHAHYAQAVWRDRGASIATATGARASALLLGPPALQGRGQRRGRWGIHEPRPR
eukprot:RCo011498